jgi:hypothetical protein
MLKCDVILTDPRGSAALAASLGKSKTLIRDLRSGKKYADVVQKIRAEIENA